MQNKRYVVVLGSPSGHCCFTSSVVDTARPVVYHGTPYLENGLPVYETVCECFSAEDANLIADALNGVYK